MPKMWQWASVNPGTTVALQDRSTRTALVRSFRLRHLSRRRQFDRLDRDRFRMGCAVIYGVDVAVEKNGVSPIRIQPGWRRAQQTAIKGETSEAKVVI